MELVTVGVFIFFFLVCGVSVLLISVYGTAEQSFEDGLLKTNEKKKDRKGRREDATSRAESPNQRKKSAKPSKKDEKEAEVKETVIKKEQSKITKPAKKKRLKESNDISSTTQERLNVLQPSGVLKEGATELETPVSKETPAEASKPVEVETKQEVKQPEVKKPAKEEKKVTGKSKILIEEVDIAPKDASVEEEVKPEPKTTKQEQPKSKAKPVEKVEAKTVEVALEPAKVEEIPLKSEAPRLSAKEGSSNKPSKKKVETAKSAPKLVNANQIMAAIRTVSFEEAEVQQIIDTLLNVQNGSDEKSVNGFSRVGDDWSGDKAMNSMKRQLTESQTLLEEEKTKNKSLNDRLSVLRTELNQTKSAKLAAQRLADEAQSRIQQTVSQYEHKLKQEVDARQREVQHLQGQVQSQAQRAQTLQASLESIQQQHQQADVESLEKLHESKSSLESELAKVRTQLDQSVAQLQEATDAKNQASAALATANQEMSTKVKELELLMSQEKAKAAEFEKVSQELESELNSLRNNLNQLETENVNLKTEISRLTVEKAESSAVTKSDVVSFDKSVYCEHNQLSVQKWQKVIGADEMASKQTLLELYNIENTTNDSSVNGVAVESNRLEKTLAEGDALINLLVDSHSALKSKLTSVEKDLEAQKSKNNAQDVSKLRADLEGELKSSIEAELPEIQVTGQNFHSWGKCFGQRVHEMLSQSEELQKQKDSVEKQANQYKEILAETESTLLKLQTEVESMESSYQEKLSKQKSVLDDTYRLVDTLNNDKATLSAKLASVEEKLSDSRQKISDLTSKLSEPAPAHVDTEELERAKSALASEQIKCQELSEELAKLNTKLVSCQKAVEQEQKISAKLRAQLASPVSSRVTPLSDDSDTETTFDDTKHLIPKTVGLDMHVEWIGSKKEVCDSTSVENGGPRDAKVPEENGTSDEAALNHEKNAAA